MSAAPTPASTKAKKSATGTFGSGTSSRGRPSAGKNTLFSGAASKSTRARYHADTDDSEPERGDTCASTDDNASPTPNAGLGKKGSSGSALGKRRRRPAHEEEGLDDSPIDYKGHLFMDQLKAAAGGVKEEPEYEGYGGGFKKVKVEKVSSSIEVVR